MNKKFWTGVGILAILVGGLSYAYCYRSSSTNEIPVTICYTQVLSKVDTTNAEGVKLSSPKGPDIETINGVINKLNATTAPNMQNENCSACKTKDCGCPKKTTITSTIKTETVQKTENKGIRTDTKAETKTEIKTEVRPNYVPRFKEMQTLPEVITYVSESSECAVGCGLITDGKRSEDSSKAMINYSHPIGTTTISVVGPLGKVNPKEKRVLLVEQGSNTQFFVERLKKKPLNKLMNYEVKVMTWEVMFAEYRKGGVSMALDTVLAVEFIKTLSEKPATFVIPGSSSNVVFVVSDKFFAVFNKALEEYLKEKKQEKLNTSKIVKH